MGCGGATPSDPTAVPELHGKADRAFDPAQASAKALWGHFEDRGAGESQFRSLYLLSGNIFRATTLHVDGFGNLYGAYVVDERCKVEHATRTTECASYLTLRSLTQGSPLERLQTYELVRYVDDGSPIDELTLRPVRESDDLTQSQTLVRAAEHDARLSAGDTLADTLQ
jgi:hypothetical protein